MTEKLKKFVEYPPDSSGVPNGCDDCAYYTAAFGKIAYCPECKAEERAIAALEAETVDEYDEEAAYCTDNNI